MRIPTALRQWGPLLLASHLIAACGVSPLPADLAPGGSESIASLTEGVWLKGDLHVHSDYSTDASNNPARNIIRFAERRGFDFLAITDHDNHVQGGVARNTWADPDFRSDTVLLLYGAEWTTARGHGNTFSAQPYDHDAVWAVRDAPEAVIDATMRRLGVHLSLNHPYAPNRVEWNDLSIFRSVEIWGSPIWAWNIPAQDVWERLLAQGLRVTGLGGSDSHHGLPGASGGPQPNSLQRLANYVGTPTTWVYARERSAEAVIEALANGRVSVSVNPNAPRLNLLADLDGDGEADRMMGDNATATGTPVSFLIRLENLPMVPGPYRATVFRNGVEWQRLDLLPGQREARFTDSPPAGERSHYRVRLDGIPPPFPDVPGSSLLAGTTVALSNPLYFNFPPRR